MIEIWFRGRGQRPNKTQMIREDAQTASPLPSEFEVEGVRYGRQKRTGKDGEPVIDGRQFALLVDPPGENISQEAVDAIATAFSDNWGGTVEHVETVVS